MLNIISYAVEKYNKLFIVASGVFMGLFYFFFRKTEKLTKENTELKNDFDTVRQESDKVSDIQKKQAEVASRPSPRWDDIHKWLRDLASKHKKK